MDIRQGQDNMGLSYREISEWENLTRDLANDEYNLGDPQMLSVSTLLLFVLGIVAGGEDPAVRP